MGRGEGSESSEEEGQFVRNREEKRDRRGADVEDLRRKHRGGEDLEEEVDRKRNRDSRRRYKGSSDEERDVKRIRDRERRHRADRVRDNDNDKERDRRRRYKDDSDEEYDKKRNLDRERRHRVDRDDDNDNEKDRKRERDRRDDDDRRNGERRDRVEKNGGDNEREESKKKEEGSGRARPVIPASVINGDASKLGKSGGVYIPPFKLARMMKEVDDKSSPEYQRLTWDALRKSINGLVNKVNATNITNIIPELFAENLIRGRGLFCRSCMKSQMASPGFTDVFAAMVAVVNTKFPQVGDLLLRRIILQLKRAYKRNDKPQLLAAVKFVAHLVNQQVAHEIIALELLTVLLEKPSDDSVEVAVGFVTECGSMLQDLSPRGLHGIFERFRGILHEGEIDKRVQFLIEGLFAIRKAKFQGYPAVRPELDLVEQEDQITHEVSLDEEIDPETSLDIFKPDPNYLENEKRYEELKKSLLGEEEESEGEEGSDAESDEDDESDEENEEAMQIKDETETNLAEKVGLLSEMASVSSQQQFRYTQPPSKVLHLRNLPWECTEEELIELGNPFGKVVNTKCNVGSNRNQAFIEFADLNQAIAMISYYASSSEPAQVRGKTVYLQYSNRQEIVHNKTAADVAGNVLLVTVEGEDARLVSIDVLHLVFSAFGFVHKITTFEKTAGFQALVQFSDAETATSAKDALDGRSIPRYLLSEHVGPCTLKITYSGHSDLTVKFQSHRSRDYTNPYLPVAQSAIEGGGQVMIGLDGKKLEAESNVLLASIENMQYAVTLDVLHMVFSAFGPIQKIAMFDKNGGLQALIQYPDTQTAVVAKEALEGHCIYDGGFCKLHLSYSRHTDLSIKVNNDRSRDYTIPMIPVVNTQPSILGQPVPMMVPPAEQYNGSQYTPISDPAMIPQSQVGWGTALPAVSQSMPLQIHNNIYMPAGNMPPGNVPMQMPPGNVPMQMPPGNMPPGSMPPGNVPMQMQPGSMPLQRPMQMQPGSMPLQRPMQMPPGNMPPGMHFPNHDMLQPTSTLPAYGSDRTQ